MMPKWGSSGYGGGGSFTGSNGVANFSANTLFWLLPYLEQGNLMSSWYNCSACNGNESITPPKVYLCPSDPTMPENGVSGSTAVSSYAANLQVFWPNVGNGPAPNLTNTFQDGTSNTALFYERYSVCTNATSMTDIMSGASIGASTNVIRIWGIGFPPPSGPESYGYILAIAYWNVGAVYSPPSAVFQSAPSINDCNPSNMQSPHIGTMNVLMADASVHSLSSGVSLTTYQAAITPAGGEVPGSDW
jgi:prepilin-type processing-associated H-X9-DG protein